MPFIINPKTGHVQNTSDRFVVAGDLQGKDTKLTIVKVECSDETLGEGRKVKRIHVYFKGAQKPLLLNTTNTKSIIAMYGSKAADWVGKVITLYPSTCKFGRGMVDCIRVRATEAQSAPPEAPKDDLDDLNPPDSTEDYGPGQNG